MNKNEDWLQKARDGWSNRGNKRPDFAIQPQEGQRSVWDFPRPPVIEKVNKPVLVTYLDVTIASSHNALAVLETASPPTYYIPREDVHMDALVPIPAKSSFCEWKGQATYWRLKQNDERAVAWSYANPLQEFGELKDYLAFYPQHLACFVDEIPVKSQAGDFYAGWITPDLTGPFKGDKDTGHW